MTDREGKDEPRRLERAPPVRVAEPGPNPLFWGSVVVLVPAVVAALLAGGAEVLQSNLVYRLLVGGITFAVGYGVLAVLWHAWHRRTLAKLGIGPAIAEAPEQPPPEEISARDREIQQFMEETTNAVADLDVRLSKHEERRADERGRE